MSKLASFWHRLNLCYPSRTDLTYVFRKCYRLHAYRVLYAAAVKVYRACACTFRESNARHFQFCFPFRWGQPLKGKNLLPGSNSYLFSVERLSKGFVPVNQRRLYNDYPNALAHWNRPQNQAGSQKSNLL